MKALPRDPIKKILVVTLSNLGDVVLTLPVIETLIRTFPKAALDVAVGKSSSQVFQGVSAIHKVLVIDKKISLLAKIKRLLEIRQRHYDVIVDLRYSPLGFFGGASTRNAYFKWPLKAKHRTLKHLRALKGIAQADLLAPSFLERLGHSGDFLKEEPDERRRIIAVAVGSKSDIKKWPAEYYAALLDRLAFDENCRIVLVGDSQDAPDVEKVKNLMRFKNPEDFCGRTDFRQLCGILKKCSLLITNDSAPLHIADALGVPTLAFFGPTDPRKYGPRNPSSLALRRSLFCSPCQKAQCRFHHECMKELGVEEAAAKAVQVLNDRLMPRNIKILIVRLDRVGDVICSLPAVWALRERFPNAFISMMVRPYTQELVEGHPWIDEVIAYCYENQGRHSGWLGNLRFLKEIAARRFDVAFILHPGHRSVLIPWMAGIPYRVGLDSEDSFFLTHKAPDRRHEGLKHESEYALDVLRAFGIENQRVEKPKLFISRGQAESAMEKLAAASPGGAGPLIAFHAGASCPSKRWPEGRFVELGRRITRELGAGVVILGGPEEASLAEDLCRRIGPAAFSLAGKLKLKETAAILVHSGFLVSNDSGPVHMAAAVGAQVLVIYGRNKAGLSPVRWRPLGEGHQLIQKDVGCQVCLAHLCPIEFECLRAVSVDEVFSFVRERWALRKEKLIAR